MKWNMNKSYLKDLQEMGIRIVDTIWEKKLLPEKVKDYFYLLNSDDIIIKPNISASAENTFRINRNNYKEQLQILKSVFTNREFMVQKFMKNIIEEGEYSLFYFGGEYSHSILKVPKESDFRVQEEHGGKIISVNPQPDLKKTAEEILSKIKINLLYARIDLVRTKSNDFALIELELIEPSLYFNYDNESPKRFARIFNDWMKKFI
jgi:glutathione synthase/RimK-type ligase-like ATP-grasp enzyme